MPTFNARTRNAEQIWASPDGQRVIYKVTLDYEGQPFEAKTYSKAIASPGFSGEVETYEKQGSRGSETFVKQVPKDTSYGQPGSTNTSSPRPSSGNDEAIARAVALKAAIELNAALFSTHGRVREDGSETITPKAVLDDANQFLAWLKNEQEQTALDNIFGPTTKLEDPWENQ